MFKFNIHGIHIIEMSAEVLFRKEGDDYSLTNSAPHHTLWMSIVSLHYVYSFDWYINFICI